MNPLTYDVSVEPIKEGYDKCGNLIPVPSDSPAKDDQNDKNNNKKDDEKEEQSIHSLLYFNPSFLFS